MTRHDESAFHARRAGECGAMARAAAGPGIAAIHERLARLHAEALARAGKPPVENYGADGAWWWPPRRVPAPPRMRAEELVAA